MFPVKAGFTLPNLLKQTKEIFHSLYCGKYIPNKVCRNLIKSVEKEVYQMETIFVNSKNSNKSEPHRCVLNLTGKINFKRSDMYVALSSLSMYHLPKKLKSTQKQ